MRPLLLPSILVLGWVLNHNIRKNNGNDQRSVNNLLRREDAANATRRKDISQLPYINVPLDTLPLNFTVNDEKKQLKIDEYVKEIHSLSEKKMLNLIGVSNTELKETYGPANLEALSIYDQTYARYIRTLYLLSDIIYADYPAEAAKLSEYCISIGTDISGTYELLGKYYLAHNERERFEELYQHIPDKESISGKTIINKLDRLSQT
jgi:hypothetical protein